MSPGKSSRPPRADIHAIRAGELFRDASDEVLRELLGQGTRSEHQSGDRIVGPGEDDGYARIVVHGAVRLDRVGGDDDTLVVAELGPGEVYGYVAGAPEIDFAESMTATRDGTVVCRIAVKDLMSFIDSHSELLRRSSAIQGRRVALAYDRMAAQTSFVPERLALRICELAESNPERRVTETQAGLARHIGASREEVTRVLGDFRRRGLIERVPHARSFTVPDPARLVRESIRPRT